MLPPPPPEGREDGCEHCRSGCSQTAGCPDQFFLIVTVSVLFAPSVAPVGALSVTVKAWPWTEVARCWPLATGNFVSKNEPSCAGQRFFIVGTINTMAVTYDPA